MSWLLDKLRYNFIKTYDNSYGGAKLQPSFTQAFQWRAVVIGDAEAVAFQ
jgi:hypothetical protein